MGYSYQIDPRRFAVIRTTALNLVAYTIPPALPVPESRVDSRCGLAIRMGLLSGGPDWIRTDLWDVAAAIPEGTFTRRPTLDDPALLQMIRTMLAERFGMVLRREKKELPVYLLKVGKDGPKFNGSIPLTKDRWGGAEIVTLGPDGKGVPVADAPPPADGGITASGGSPFGRPDAGASVAQLSARNMSMTNLSNYMFGLDGRPVFDRTGLTGRYDFHYADAGVQEALKKFAERVISMQILETNAGGNRPGSALMRNLVKEIGLELEESIAPFDAWVIERVEKPMEN
jgi:uncharacterized protein (TIGR03435 family)